MNERHILVVDSDETFAQATVKLLKSRNYQVDTASSGAETLEKANQYPDLILLDRALSSIGGVQVCQKIREDRRLEHISIIAFTSQNEASQRVEGFSLGADDCISKPIDDEELIARIEAVLKRNHEGLSFWSIDKNYIQGPIRTAEWNQREVNIGDIQASLSYQPSLFNHNSGSPQAIFDGILKEEGFDVKLIRAEGRSTESVENRNIVIAKLWNRGVRNLSQIGRFVNREHGTILNSLKNLGLRK